MRPTFASLLCLLVSVAFPGVCLADEPPTWGDLQAGSHAIGFRLIEESDPSRFIRTDSRTGPVLPRPIRVYVWYPAAPSPQQTPMTFGRYADLADDDVWPETALGGARDRTRFRRRPLARSLGKERFEALRTEEVGAVEDAPEVAGPFPVVVVGQGLYYESPIAHAILCELLASHGFVVATAPLVGTHSPLVNVDVIDLETQTRDLEWVIARVRRLAFASQDRIGLLGFDMGAMACLILAMRNPDVDALATIDSAILFAPVSGIPQGSPHYDPGLLRIPWFHGTQSAFGIRPEDYDGPALFDRAVYAARYLMLIEGVGHADFTSYALIEDREPMIGYWGPRQGGEKERYEVLCRYLLGFFAGYLGGDVASRELLAKDPEKVAPGMGITLEHRPAVSLGPVYSDFLNALITGRIDAAVEISRALRKGAPDGPLLREEVLTRLGFHLIISWEMFDEGIEVMKLNAELHPESVNAWDSLGVLHMMKGENEKAKRCFLKVLELDPDYERAKRILRELESR